MKNINFIVCSKAYFETIKKLREKIKKGNIQSILIPKGERDKNYTCFFCLGKINENMNMRILQETEHIRGYKTGFRYAIDEICYQFSKNFKYIKTRCPRLN